MIFNQIRKYELLVNDHQIIPIKGSSEPLCVQMQGGKIMLWARVSEYDSGEIYSMKIGMAGTGHEAPSGKYIGTVQADDGMVWHIFLEW